MKNRPRCCHFLVLTALIVSICTGYGTIAGAAPVPVLIRDIDSVIKDDSGIGNLQAVGSTLYFTAWDRAHGREPWKSNGTAAGTAMVKDVYVGETGSQYTPNYLTPFNGSIYFTANHPTYGWSFWKSDGTDAGTVPVKDHLDAKDTVVMNGAMYLSDNGSGLWKSDGTTAGTLLIKDGISGIDNLTVVGSLLFFTAGDDIWRSDGTDAGTIVLASSVYPIRLTAVGTTLFFRGWTDANGYELWRSNGAEAGTVIVEDMIPGDASGNPDHLTNLNGTLYFSATDDMYGSGLWKCATTGSPVLVESGISPADITNVNGTLYFATGNDLWKSDGTSGGTVLVKADIYPDKLLNVNGTLFFQGWTTAAHYELWKSNGTDAGTVLVKDINPGTGEGNPNFLTNVNGTLYFIATEPTNGTQLWKSDGTEAGTLLVKNVSPGSQDANPASFSNIDGTLFFSAFDGDDAGLHGTELWQSNGTLAGTSMVQDINPGWNSGNPQQITNANGTIYFKANGDDLWKRVGTGAAAMVRENVYPDQLTWVSGLNLLFFEGWNSANGYELWKSDGTAAGTVMVKDILTGTSGANVNSFIGFNNILYFIATSSGTGAQLWKSDGTDAGTVLVRSDIRDVKNLTRVGTRLYFTGDSYNGATLVHNDSLWVFDGTTVTEIMWGIWPEKLTAVGNTLFFRAQNSYGDEIWKSDGTQAGTVMVKDIRAGGSGSNPENLTNVNGTLFFTVWNSWDTPDSVDLWKSNGTEAGTVKVKSMVTTWSGYVSQLTSVHGLLAFTFEDDLYGKELWTSNGTEAGTTMVKDIFPDPSGFGSSPANLTMAVAGTNVLNEALFFSAIDELAGRELYILDFTPPVSAITSPVNGAHLRGTSITISGTSGDSMPGTGVNLMQLSTNNGSTWNGTGNTSAAPPWATWQYTWNNPADGVYTIKSRATDLATNVQAPLASITVTVDNTRPVVTFSMPPVSHSSTVPITFSASDSNGIAGYCLTTSSSSSGCSWSATAPTSYTFPSEGSKTIYAWARDPAGNVSAVTSDTVLVSLPHTLNIDLAGSGSGTVTFGSQVFNTDHSVTVYSFDQVTLVPNESTYSIFSGWTNICTGTGSCVYTVPTLAGGGDHTATATFTFDWPHSVLVSPNYYSGILSAYQAASTVNGASIRAWGTDFSETLLFDLDKRVSLIGGYNQAHTDNSGGVTTVPGPVTFQNGEVTVEGITVR